MFIEGINWNIILSNIYWITKPRDKMHRCSKGWPSMYPRCFFKYRWVRGLKCLFVFSTVKIGTFFLDRRYNMQQSVWLCDKLKNFFEHIFHILAFNCSSTINNGLSIYLLKLFNLRLLLKVTLKMFYNYCTLTDK